MANLLTVAATAEALALKEPTIRMWIAKRRIGYVRVGRRAIRVPREEVERLLREGAVPAKERGDGRGR